MLLLVYLVFALSAGVLLGYRLKRNKNGRVEELKKGMNYRVFAGNSVKFMNYYVVALVLLDEPDAFPKWYRCRQPLPSGHAYLKAVSVKGGIVLKPFPKATPSQVPVSLKA